jgi:hypothetical protein
MSTNLCSRCHAEPRRSATQRLGRRCHAKAMVETRRRNRERLNALLALVPRDTPTRVERTYSPETAKRISETKLARNAERRQAGAR